MRRRHLITALGATGAALAAPALRAQPAGKPIRLIVPFTAGGPIDLTMRLLAEKAAPLLGTTMVIENRPGGGGGIGVDQVAKAAPDGLTLGVAATAMNAINPWLFARIPYDPIKDFAFITQTVRIPNVLVMNAETAKRLNIASFADFLKYARANPGKLNYGSGGNGSAGHLGGEMFKTRAGIFAVHIPYSGGAPSQLALLSGQVDYTLDNLATAGPNIRAGKIVPLAVTSARRTPLLPEVPPMADTFAGFEIDTWWGVLAPAATPREVVKKLNTAFVATLELPDVKQRYQQMLAEPAPSTPEQFTEFVKRELARYEKVVKASGVKLE